MSKKRTFRLVFHNQGKIYELFAREVSQADMYGFIEVGDLQFGERSAVLVDPGEERLKSEFEGVKRTFIPMHSVIRIDEVEQRGQSKVTDAGDSTVTPFPVPAYGPARDPKS